MDAAQYAFTDTIDLTAGQTIHVKVTADVKTANTRTGTDIEVGSKVAMVLENYASHTGLTEMKYSGTNTALAAGDVVPNANIAGPSMTVKSSSLTLGLASNPPDQTVVQGTQNIDAVGITFTATNASALKVTDITLTGYSDDDNAPTNIGSAGDIADMVSSVALYEKESGTLISSTPTTNSLAATSGTVVFNSLNWNIPAGSTKTLLVRANLLNLAPPTEHWFGFDIAATTDVTAVDSSNNSVNAGNEDPNGAGNLTTAVNYTSAGTIYVSEYESSPSKSKHSVYWGQAGVTLAQFKVRTVNEGFYIETFNLVATSGYETYDKNNVKNVYLSYLDKNGNTVTSSGQSLNTATVPSVSFGFSGDSRPYIPADSSRVITVKVDTINTYAQGGTSGVPIKLSFSGVNTDEFKAIGEGSQATASGNTRGQTAGVSPTNGAYVYRSFPKIVAVSIANGPTSGNSVIGKFDITAMGYDVLFGTTDAASSSLIFDTLSSGSLSQAAATLYEDSTNLILDTGTLDSAANNASLSFSQFTNALSIPGGTTKRVRVEANLSTFNDPVNTSTGLGADYFQLILQDQANVIKWVDSASADANGDAANVAGYLETLPAYGPYLTAQ
jgi:hypothetical protein